MKKRDPSTFVPAISALVVGAALLLGACDVSKKGGAGHGGASAGVGVLGCPFAPVKLVIHPLTRLAPAPAGEEGLIIDVHIELRDETGDDVKGVGMLAFELFREGGPLEGMGDRRQLRRWEADISDLEKNSEAFDRVTRTYRFELAGVPPDARTSQRLGLRATFSQSAGRQLSAEHRFAP